MTYTARPLDITDVLTQPQLDQLAQLCQTVKTHGHGEVTIVVHDGKVKRVKLTTYHLAAVLPFTVGPENWE